MIRSPGASDESWQRRPDQRLRGRRTRLALLALTATLAAGCSGSAPTATVTGGSPGRATPPAPGSPAAELVSRMSLDQQLGQLFVPQVYGSSATEVTPAQALANQALLGVRTPAEAIARYHLAGVTLLEKNTTDPQFGSLPTGNALDPKQLRGLTDGLGAAARTAGDPLPLVIALDQEGGTVIRLREPATEMPSEMAIGATGDPQNARQLGVVTGTELRAVGVTVDLAPVADLASLPGNTVIGTRSFGSDPGADGRFVAAEVAGLQSTGIAATLKHFPGHGGTDVDSHQSLPTLPQTAAQLEANDLVPFRAGIDGGVRIVMAGHLRVPAYDPDLPASLSPVLINGLLREKLGFGGVVITDGMGMGAIRDRFDAGEAAIRAVLAGDDLISLSANTAQAYAALQHAVRSGRVPAAVVRAAATRVVQLRMSLPSAAATIEQVGSAEHQAVAARIAAASVTSAGCATTIPRSVQVVGSSSSAVQALSAALAARGVAVGSGPLVTVVGSEDFSLAARPAAATVSVGKPYVLADSRAPVRLAVYGDVPASIDAAADVLTGRGGAPGHLPVPVRLVGGCSSR
jgi:beta-N-acetylhexosaminidase